MATVQDVLDRARLVLQDATTNAATGAAVTPRNPDADLLKRANDGIARTFAIRPDLRFGSYGTAFTDLVATSSFPLPIEYRPAIAAYVVAATESEDDSFANSAKADQSMVKYMRELGLA